MTHHERVKTKKPYVPFDPAYLLYSNTADEFLEQKSSGLTDRIIGLYQQLYERKEISQKVLGEVQEEFLEASSEIYNHRHMPFLPTKQISALERRVDLLEKTKWSELVEYWKDTTKIRTSLLYVIQEYKELKIKKNILK